MWKKCIQWNKCTVQMNLNLNLIASLDFNSNVLGLHGQKNILDDTTEMQSGKSTLLFFINELQGKENKWMRKYESID